MNAIHELLLLPCFLPDTQACCTSDQLIENTCLNASLESRWKSLDSKLDWRSELCKAKITLVYSNVKSINIHKMMPCGALQCGLIDMMSDNGISGNRKKS